MRLTPGEVAGICASVAKFVRAQPATLYLYGSRVDDTLKGGDIDLLLLADKATAEKLAPQKYSMLTAIKEKLGERRIDLTIASFEHAKQDVFLSTVLPGAICLQKWGA